MNIDLKIGWNDLSAECKDVIRKLHKLGCKVNIIYPMIEPKEHNNHASNSVENRSFNGESSNVRTFTTSVNDFIYQDINPTSIGSGAG